MQTVLVVLLFCLGPAKNAYLFVGHLCAKEVPQDSNIGCGVKTVAARSKVGERRKGQNLF